MYSEIILREELENENGIQVGGHSITNIRYADDTVLFSESEKDLQRLLNVVVKESERMGLEINYTMTKCLVVSKKRRAVQNVTRN